MLSKIKKFITRPRPRKIDVELYTRIVKLEENMRTTDAHLVALARLAFVKAHMLVKEANNNKANGEYLLTMVEAKKGLNESKKDNSS